MNALEFNRRIRIEKPGARDPLYGKATGAWELVVEVWAKVEDAKPSKSDTVRNGLALAVDSATVWIRNRKGLASNMRIVELSGRQRVLSITGGPAEINGGRDLEFTVERFSS